MTDFSRGQRVRVIAPGPLRGCTGTVDRLRHADDGAWITMDDPLPEGMASFPDGDPRHRNTIFYPEDCEPCEPSASK